MKNFISNVTNINPLEYELLDKFDGYEGKDCTLCADMCPMPNPLSAIAMITTKTGIIKPEIYDGCTGCGVCQEVCPVEGPAIVIIPRAKYNDIYKS